MNASPCRGCLRVHPVAGVELNGAGFGQHRVVASGIGDRAAVQLEFTEHDAVGVCLPGLNGVAEYEVSRSAAAGVAGPDPLIADVKPQPRLTDHLNRFVEAQSDVNRVALPEPGGAGKLFAVRTAEGDAAAKRMRKIQALNAHFLDVVFFYVVALIEGADPAENQVATGSATCQNCHLGRISVLRLRNTQLLRVAHGQSCGVKQLHQHAIGLAIPGGPAHREALAPRQHLEVPGLGVCRQGGELVDRPCGDVPRRAHCKVLHTNLLGFFLVLTQDPGDDKTVVAQGADHRRLGVHAFHARGQQGQGGRDDPFRVHIRHEGLTRVVTVHVVRLIDQNECAIGAQSGNSVLVLIQMGDEVWLDEQRLPPGDTILIKTLSDQAPVSCISRHPHHHKVAFATQCSNLGVSLTAAGLWVPRQDHRFLCDRLAAVVSAEALHIDFRGSVHLALRFETCEPHHNEVAVVAHCGYLGLACITHVFGSQQQGGFRSAIVGDDLNIGRRIGVVVQMQVPADHPTFSSTQRHQLQVSDVIPGWDSEGDGVWRVLRGRPVFVKDLGEDVSLLLVRPVHQESTLRQAHDLCRRRPFERLCERHMRR